MFIPVQYDGGCGIGVEVGEAAGSKNGSPARGSCCTPVAGEDLVIGEVFVEQPEIITKDKTRITGSKSDFMAEHLTLICLRDYI